MNDMTEYHRVWRETKGRDKWVAITKKSMLNRSIKRARATIKTAEEKIARWEKELGELR